MKKIMEKLNKHFFPLLVVAVLLVSSCLPIKASAAEHTALDYSTLDYTVKYGTSVNTVTYEIPSSYSMFWWLSYSGESVKESGSNTLELSTEPGKSLEVRVFPASYNGLLLDNIPVGSKIYIDLALDQSSFYANEGWWAIYKRSWYLDTDTYWLNETEEDCTWTTENSDVFLYELDYMIEEVPGAVSFVPSIRFENFTGNDSGKLRLKIVSARVEMEVPVEFWSQFQAEQNGKLLNDMVNGTDEQHAIVNDSVQGMQQAGSKLDGLGDQLNSVEKPNVDNMDVSADKLLGGMAATSMLTAPVREIWKNPVALSILTVVVTIVLISWVFFGKK